MVRSFSAFLCALAFVALASRAAFSSTAEPLDRAALREAISRHVGHPRFAAAQWGIKIAEVGTGAVLFETNAAKLLKPASNAKLYTAALALDSFGRDFRIRTSLYARKNPSPSGVLPGDLIVYGRGDFSMSARFRNGSYSNLLGEVIAEVKRAGIRRIDGDLVGDETFFSGPRAGSGWTWDDLSYYYGAEVSALTLQDNVVDLVISPGKPGRPSKVTMRPATDFIRAATLPITLESVGSTDITIYRPLGARDFHVFGALAVTNRPLEDAVPVPDPALWFVTMLRSELAREGIKVRGKSRAVGWPQKPAADTNAMLELGATLSRPMRELVARMLKPSQNLYAQLLLLQAGARRSEPHNSTEDLGIRALRDFLAKAGISRDEVLLEEGSGLSRSCLVTPNATAQLLLCMAEHPHGATFADCLPEPGGEGTLRRRLLDLKGRVRAKTGTLRYVNTLSGYALTASGKRAAFSIMLNAYKPAPGADESREEIDEIVRLICRLTET